jgi:hypothetical protein
VNFYTKYTKRCLNDSTAHLAWLGSHDSYIIDGDGNLLPIEPAGLAQMGAFVKSMHALGLKVVPMIGAEARPRVQPAMWSLLHNSSQQTTFIAMAVAHAVRHGYDGYHSLGLGVIQSFRHRLVYFSMEKH